MGGGDDSLTNANEHTQPATEPQQSSEEEALKDATSEAQTTKENLIVGEQKPPTAPADEPEQQSAKRFKSDNEQASEEEAKEKQDVTEDQAQTKQTESVTQTEPTQTEPTQTEPTQTEPTQTEPVTQAEPTTQAEPITQAESVTQSEHMQTESQPKNPVVPGDSTTLQQTPVSDTNQEVINQPPLDPSTNQETANQQRVLFEENFQFEQSIKEEAKKLPLVCLEESIHKLFEEYKNGSEVYRYKITKLAQRHGKIRRCRGDGNCFYRAFAFAWFEQLWQSRNSYLHETALRAMKDTKQILEKAGYQPLVFEDIYDVVKEQLEAIANNQRDLDTLLSVFQTEEISNHIVWYLRIVTAAFLKFHRDEYEPFLELDIGMDDYCSHFVEVMDQEADHVHVTALTRALKVRVEIAYMSGSNALDEVNFHEFYPEQAPSGLKPLVLLYRPGHYDILYRRNEQ